MSWGRIQFWTVQSSQLPLDIIKGSRLYRWLTRLALGNSACDKKKKNPEPNMIMSLLILSGTSSLSSVVRLIAQKPHFYVGGPDGLSFPLN